MGKSHGQGLKNRRENAFQTLHLPPFAQGSKALEAVEDGKGGAKGCAKPRAGTGWRLSLIIPILDHWHGEAVAVQFRELMRAGCREAGP